MSSNGTFLNGEIIGKGKRVQLLDGDSLDLLVAGEAVKDSESIGFIAEIKTKENEKIKELEQSVINQKRSLQEIEDQRLREVQEKENHKKALKEMTKELG
jgi:hypothetical protein